MDKDGPTTPGISFAEMMRFEPRIPTDAELRPGAMATARLAAPFALQRLPVDVLALAIPVQAVPVTPAQAGLLVQAWGAHHDRDEAKRDAFIAETGLVPALDAAVSRCGGEAFAKLGTRSAKDGYDTDRDSRPNPVRSGTGALLHLLASFERVFVDLENARVTGIETAIVIRPFVRFAPDREYRAYVASGEVIGISQMYYDRPHADPVRARAEDEPRMRALLKLLVPAMKASRCRVVDHGDYATVEQDGGPCQDFTTDLAVLPDGRAVLVEVNPPVACGLVDPTLFRDAAFDGSFRILDEEPDAQADVGR